MVDHVYLSTFINRNHLLRRKDRFHSRQNTSNLPKTGIECVLPNKNIHFVDYSINRLNPKSNWIGFVDPNLEFPKTGIEHAPVNMDPSLREPNVSSNYTSITRLIPDYSRGHLIHFGANISLKSLEINYIREGQAIMMN